MVAGSCKGEVCKKPEVASHEAVCFGWEEAAEMPGVAKCQVKRCCPMEPSSVTEWMGLVWRG